MVVIHKSMAGFPQNSEPREGQTVLANLEWLRRLGYRKKLESVRCLVARIVLATIQISEKSLV